MNRTDQNNVGEPNEVEAWKMMMDSMVKFIAASTKLMKTITTRAEVAVTPEASSDPKSSCEVECIMCPTRSAKECGVCAAGKPVEVEKTKPPESGEPPAAPPTEEAAQKEEAPAEQDAAEKPPETAEAEEPQKPSEPEAQPEVQQKDADKNYCVCSEIRLIKKEASKAGVSIIKKHCGCTRKSAKCGGPKSTKEGEGKQLCACDVGPAEKKRIITDLADKLNKTQEDLAAMQKEMARLQQMDAMKNSQSAALYREIMKDNCLDKSSRASRPNSAGYQQPSSRALGASKSAGSAPSKGARKKPVYDDPTTSSSVINCSQIRSTHGVLDAWQGYEEDSFGQITPIEKVRQPFQSDNYADPSPPAFYSLGSAEQPYSYENPQMRRSSFGSHQQYDNFGQPAMVICTNEVLDNNFIDDPYRAYQEAPRAFAQRQREMIPASQSAFPPEQRAHRSRPQAPMYDSSAAGRKQRFPGSTGRRMQPMAPYPRAGPEQGNVCRGVCFTGPVSQNAYVPDSDYVNPEFVTESQEFARDECYDDSCDDSCDPTQ